MSPRFIRLTRQLSDYILTHENIEKLSSNYLLYGILFGFFRIFWIIGETSGLFGQPPDAWIGSIAKLITLFYGLALIAGLAFFVEVYRRQQAGENEPISFLIMNYIGVLLMFAFTWRVSYVIHESPEPFETWAKLAVNGIIQGGVYALIALGYTLVYGILFMINFAHGEIMMFGAYSGYFAMQYLTGSGHRSFEDGSAILATTIIPLIVGLLFLPLQRMRRQQDGEATAPGNQITLFLGIPFRFMMGVLIGYGALSALGSGAPHIYFVVISFVGIFFAMLVGMFVSTVLAIGLENGAYRPLRKAPRLVPLISAIGASIFLQEVARRIFGSRTQAYPNVDFLSDPTNIYIGMGSLGKLPVSKVGIMIVIASIALMLMLYIIVQRTKIGKAMRAVAEDKDTAALMGIDVDRVIVFTFMLGAALAGAAGVMLGIRGELMKPRFGFQPGLKAFTAAVLGGIGNIPGAMVGGFFLGFVESVGPLMLGITYDWKNAIAFSLLVIVLIFRPTGILGELVAGKKV